MAEVFAHVWQMTLKMSVMGQAQMFEQMSTRFVMRNRITPTSA